MGATDSTSAVLAPGTKVPEFKLTTESGESFTEADLQGKTTVFVFYPFAFSPVCTDQLQIYEQSLPEIKAQGADIYGVSCDSGWSQKAFREKLDVSIPQLSDFEPKGAACSAFGVLHPGGFPQRALVIVDRDGVVRWSYQAPSPADLPPVHMILGGLKNA
ncbi:MAG: redoxin domain-containing protein [Solirubrobacteraceae bacterium]